MQIRSIRCLLPDILRERNIEPVDFYTDPDIGWTKQQYSNIANTKHLMSLLNCIKVSYKLGVPIEDLYDVDIIDAPRKGADR